MDVGEFDKGVVFDDIKGLKGRNPLAQDEVLRMEGPCRMPRWEIVLGDDGAVDRYRIRRALPVARRFRPLRACISNPNSCPFVLICKNSCIFIVAANRLTALCQQLI